MKIQLRASLAALFLFVGVAEARMDLIDGWIEKVSDGDSIWLQTEPMSVKFARSLGAASFLHSALDEGKDTRLKVRMVGIDAPETQLPVKGEGIVSQGHWGDEATLHLAKLLPLGLKVKMEDYGLDTYRRTLGRIIKDGKDVNIDMVATGHAVTYVYCEGEDCRPGFFEEHRAADYVRACERAMASGLGIWDPADPLEEMPFAFRLRKQDRVPEKWSGHFTTKNLIEPEDFAKVPDCQRIWFRSRAEAKRVGYEPRG